MAKLRLNQEMRAELVEMAKAGASFPELIMAKSNAFSAAQAAVRELVEKEYPPRDMAILKRYKVAHEDDCILLKCETGGDRRFEFAENTGPLTPSRRCSDRMFIADASVTAAVIAYEDAKDALERAIKTRLSDYRALIFAARNLEDITPIWPEAEAIRAQFGSRELTVVNSELIERIKADQARRAA